MKAKTSDAAASILAAWFKNLICSRRKVCVPEATIIAPKRKLKTISKLKFEIKICE